jgi:tRNA threonylcarbamoyladenosine biosynthesis protein TsaE
MEYISKSEIETKNHANRVLNSLEKNIETAKVIALCGNLGAGKTTFTQGLAEVLEVSEQVNSPTFVLEKIYKINKKCGWEHLIHIDTYRLDNEAELIHLGWEEIISNPNNLIVIEWADKIEKILPKSTTIINFEFIDEETRKISW